MNNENKDWIESVFQSMKGSKRAMPRPELFSEIEDHIMSSASKVISIFQWKQSTAAAVIILIVNSTVLINYNNYSKAANHDVATIDSRSQSLISNYQIYK